MSEYYFTAILKGEGDDPDEAWRDAVDQLAIDPGPHPVYVISDDDADNDPRYRDEFAAPDWNGDPSEY